MEVAMLRKLKNELLWKDDFLSIFEKDLKELYTDPAFMEIVHRIIRESTFPDDQEALSKIKNTVKSLFYHERLPAKYDALGRIVDAVKQRGCTAASAHISVFMSMWIYDLSNVSAPVSANPRHNDLDIRKKWPTEYRCSDGHYVRSKNEVLVDNWLYQHDICHGYEKAVFSESGDQFLSDFYIPSLKLFVEIWGYDNEKYRARAKHKRQVYATQGYELLEIFGDDVMILDDFLTKNILARRRNHLSK